LPAGAFPIEGTVRGFPSRQRGIQFDLETALGGFRIRAEDPGWEPLPGQRVRLRAMRAPSEGPTNPGQFDFPAYLRSQNLRGTLKAESIAILQGPGLWDRLVIAARHAMLRGLDRAVPAEQAPLLRAALVGDTDGLDPGLVDDFKASGMLHILAISGQHVGIIVLICLQIGALLGLPRKAAFVATAALLALYVPICGGQVSVLRAALMFACGLPGVLWERPGSALNNLGWSAAFTLIFMPWDILSLGFQLSYAATFLLILYARPLAQLMTRWRVRRSFTIYLFSTPLLSLALFLGAYPLLAAASHLCAPSSLFGNLATIGLSSAMLVCACLALLAAPATAVAACFGACAGGLGALLGASVHALARLPGSAVAVAGMSLPWGLVLIFAVLVWPYALRARRGRVVALACAALFAGRWVYAEFRATNSRGQVAFLDVGQGDGAVLRLPGAVILIDAGPAPAGRDVVLPYLRSQGIDRIDLAVVTHPDIDHYGGLAYVAGHMPIGRFLYPGVDADTHAWIALKRELTARHVPIDTARRGQILYTGAGDTLRVLSPERAAQYKDRNDNSVTALLRLGDRTALFTGDLGPEAEERLLELEPRRLAGAILKVPHHGSDLSNAVPFLQAVRAPQAVISSGRINRFGHPGPATVAALRSLGSALYCTARDGALALSADGGWSRFLPSDTSLLPRAPPRPPRRAREAPSGLAFGAPGDTTPRRDAGRK
jgi:competence protein ComEC